MAKIGEPVKEVFVQPISEPIPSKFEPVGPAPSETTTTTAPAEAPTTTPELVPA